MKIELVFCEELKSMFFSLTAKPCRTETSAEIMVTDCKYCFTQFSTRIY